MTSLEGCDCTSPDQRSRRSSAYTACPLVTAIDRQSPFDRHATGTLPMQTVQILGAQVCAFPPQVHPSAGPGRRPSHAGQ
jgi:hypothetical protein